MTEKQKWENIFLEDCAVYDKKIAEEYKTLQERIAELEKENAELKSLKDVADLIRLNNSSVVAMAQLNNNNVALRQENAELKKENEIFKKANEIIAQQRDDRDTDISKLESRIEELEAYNEKLLDSDIEKHNKIVELQKRNGELAGQKASLERWFGEAKDLIKRLLKATYGEGWNYSLQVKVEAEQFLKESE